MYIGKDFDDIDPQESEVFSLNFGRDVAHGVTINSATWTITPIVGADALAATRMIGSPVNNGTLTSQRIALLLPGVKYLIQAVVLTSDGDTKSLWSHVSCKAPS